MEYQIGALAQLAGVSTRTLRYYHEIGLLLPARLTDAGYRVYGTEQVDRLQQILFFRALDLPLEEVQELMNAQDFSVEQALEQHLHRLRQKQKELEDLILLAEQSIEYHKGERNMTDEEKFTQLKQNLLEQNEATYGEEIREAYGEQTVDASNARFLGLTQQEMERMEEIGKEIGVKLAEAVAQGDPTSVLGQEVAALHQQWLSFTWDSYHKEKHLGLVEMYVVTPEFIAYYDAYGEGATQFLVQAVRHFLA